jgi:Bacterial RNA polymerase, alpha chain C terminal domain
MEEDDEPLSEQLPLPEIDMSSKARFQRSRERRIGLVLALIEKVLLKETENGLQPEDIAEAARRLPSIVEKIAKKRASTLNAEKSTEKRSKYAEEEWQSEAERLANKIREKDIEKSQEKVAGEIGPLLGDLRGQRTLVRFISRLEKAGRLPRSPKPRLYSGRAHKRPPVDPLSVPWLGTIETSLRLETCLIRGGYQTIGQLKEATDDELLHVNGMGKKFLAELRALVASYEHEDKRNNGKRL